MEQNSGSCRIDPVELGIKMASLERDMSDLRDDQREIVKWQKRNWNYTKSMHKKVRIMSLALRRHRLVFGGIWGFVCLSSLLAWELAKDWIKMKIKLLIGG